jgi:signal transduction histidine kinase
MRGKATGDPFRGWLSGRVLRWVGVAALVLVAVTTVTTDPRPGLEGRPLAILVVLVVYCASFVFGVVWRRRDGTGMEWQVALALTLLFTSSVALIWLQPDGLGWLGAFAAIGAAAWRLHIRTAALLYVGCLIALGIHLGLSGASASQIALSELGAVIFVSLSISVVQLRRSQREQARLIIELEETREAQAQAAALRERGRLAREMHDVLAHSLSGLLLQLEGARMLASRGTDPQIADAIDRAHHLARAGLDEARRAIGMLRDDELPGPERLPALAAEFEHDNGVPVTLAVSGAERALGSEARLTVFRTAQEALTNARRHAHPSHIDLRLSYEADGTRLVVEDQGQDGVAAGSLSSSGGGYGLTGMRERAELIGGRLHAARTSDGFRVELWVPA